MHYSYYITFDGKRKMVEKSIKTMMVFEILGRPAEHLEVVLNQLIDKIGSEKGIEITEKKIHEPKFIEKKDKDGKIVKREKGREMYSTFAEVQLKGETILDILRIMFMYMPSHIELISPSEFEFKNFDLTAILNEITRKLHNYDAIAKNALLHNKTLKDRIEELESEKKTKKKSTKKKK